MFNPAPPDKNRFERHAVVTPSGTDVATEVNEFLDDLKKQMADEAIQVAVSTDQYPTSIALNADFVVMPTAEYRDNVCQAYDDGCKVILQTRINEGFDPQVEEHDQVIEKMFRAVDLACSPVISHQVRGFLKERIGSYQQEIGLALADTEEGLRELLTEKIKQAQADTERYKQALTVCAEAIRLLNITLADEDDEEAEE